MNVSFPSKATLTVDQETAINIGPNLIITGAAGSGKTFLAIIIAENLILKYPSANIAIIIVTKSLKRFINEALQKKGIQKAKAYYQYEWDSLKAFEFIIVDEAQDFSLIQLKKIRESCTEGVYFIGDSNQRIFKEDFRKQLQLQRWNK